MSLRSLIASLAVASVYVQSAAAAAADLEAGRTKSLACQACHGANGQGTAADIPNLAAQQAVYLKTQLTAFRAGTRQHDLMNAIASQLSDADIDDLAAFWNSVSASAAAGTDPAADFRKSQLQFPAKFPQAFVAYAETKADDGALKSRSYINQGALAAARQREPLPNGTTIVVENYANGAVVSYAAMGSKDGWGDGVPELLRNGDWSYALFDAQKQRRDFNYARCLACHKPKADTSYVFGYEDLAKK